MTSQTHSSEASSPHLSPVREMTVQLASTKRGAHLARHLAVEQLAQWGLPDGGEASWSAALVVAELAANAVRHGHLPGRDFQLSLTLTRAATARLLRIEVSDARAEHGPRIGELPSPEAESGRGLIIVNALATHWGGTTRHPVGKTIWCELAIPHPHTAPAPVSAPVSASG